MLVIEEVGSSLGETSQSSQRAKTKFIGPSQHISTTNFSPYSQRRSIPQTSIDYPTNLKMAPKEDSRAARKPGPKPLQSSSPKTQYLILYNFVNAVLWLTVLGRVVLLVPLVGFGRVYPGVGRFCKWTQTLAVLEVVHAATGKLLWTALLTQQYILLTWSSSQAS